MLTINGAGISASDPILAGLTGRLSFGASSLDVATVMDAWLDQVSIFPGVNTVKSDLSPAYTNLIAGADGVYDDATDRLNLNSTSGLSVNDTLYLSHIGITPGLYEIASIPISGQVTLRNDPFAGSGNKTGILYQVAWSYQLTMGNSPSITSGPGTQNYFKAQVKDQGDAEAQLSEFFYIRSPPAGAGYISLGGVPYTGGVISVRPLTLSILNGWNNNGGIATVELVNHSVQAANNFTWTADGGSAEKAITAAESSGITVTPGDGMKYGRLLFRTLAGSSHILGVDIQISLDTTGPVLTMTAFGT